MNRGGPETSETVFERWMYVHFSRERVNNFKMVKYYFDHMIYIITIEITKHPQLCMKPGISPPYPKMYLVAISYIQQVTSEVSSCRGTLALGSA